MKILSWNVNGIRAREKAGLVENLKAIDADIVCLQETRAKKEQLNKETIEYFNTEYKFWQINDHTKAGYAGVLIASKIAPINLSSYLFNDSENYEFGREIIVPFPDFTLITLYSPNSGRNLEKLPERLSWENHLYNYIQKHNNRPFIICGDMNVAPEKIDCNVFSKSGTSKEEREAFSELCRHNKLVDTFRYLKPLSQQFSWFSNTYDSHTNNKGMRIDHFLMSEDYLPNLLDSQILNTNESEWRGSDHCPILLTLRG